MNFLNLQMLLAPWKVNVPEVYIKDIKLDSRDVSPHDLFVAIDGHQNDGRFYICDAIDKGVSAVISEAYGKKDDGCVYHVSDKPVIHLYNLKDYLSLLAGRFYRHPSSFLNLVGVTGTNGKTTVSHLLCQWVHLLSERVAIMGTLGNGLLNHLVPSLNTTLSAVETQKMLAYFYQKGVNFVAMEVSSHALVQKRVHNLYFQVAIFTNLTHDHLDYHGNMLAYELSKWRLFSELEVEEYIINGDDFVGWKWLSKLSRATVVTCRESILKNWRDKWLCVISVRCYDSGFDVMFNSSWGKGLIHSTLIGRYNINNVLLALAALLVLGYPLSKLLDKAHQLRSVSGRMEIYKVSGFPTVVVDYAHTPDALKKVLLEIRSYCLSNQIWCVFGCGGNRDRSKRSIMGKIVSKYADNIIITDDNPRTEQSQNIINDIKVGLVDAESKCVQVIPHREEALRFVLGQAQKGDWILIAGKGHENYQIIGRDSFVYSDQSVIKNLLGIDK